MNITSFRGPGAISKPELTPVVAARTQLLLGDRLPRMQRPAAAALSSALSGLVAQVGLQGSLPGLWSPCVSPESSRLAPCPLQGRRADKPFQGPGTSHLHMPTGQGGSGLGLLPRGRFPGSHQLRGFLLLCLSVHLSIRQESQRE